MSQHDPEYIDLCAGWALGCLDPVDQTRFDQHVARGCRECEMAMANFSAATVLVAASAARAVPDPALRQRVLAAAGAMPVDRADAPRKVDLPPSSFARDATPLPDRKLPPPIRDGGSSSGRVVEFRPRPAWTVWAPIAAAAVLALTSGVLWMRAQTLATDLGASRGQITQLEKRIAEEQKWAQVLAAPEARVSVLEPTTDGDPRMRARATYDPTTKRAVLVFENVGKPNARDYELWVIRGGAPASLGLITADAQGNATLHLENVGDSFALSAFAVSIEPEGGSPNAAAPSGPVVMLGKLSS